MRTVEVYGGTMLRVRPVPPHVWRSFHALSSADLPPQPPDPVRHVQTADGRTETVPAVEGTLEYDAWRESWDAWAQANAPLVAKVESKREGLIFEYAVVGWRRGDRPLWRRLLDRLAGRWETEPPTGWEPDAALERYGIGVEDGGRRIAYIRLELLTTPRSYEVLSTAVTMQDLTEKEVEAQLRGFPA